MTDVEAAGRDYQQSLERAAEEHGRIQQEWHATRERYEADLVISRTQHDQLAQAIQDMNRSYAALVSQHTAERAELEMALRTERSRCAELVGEREQWRADLVAILRTVGDAGVPTQQLLDRCRNMRLVSTANQDDRVEVAEPNEVSALATGTEEECSWQF